MSCYFIASIKINDEEEYKKYLEEAGDVFKKFKGRYLSVDNNPVVLEGKWDYSRIVLIEFPDKGELDRWYCSDEYRRILKFRLSASVCDTIIAKGL